MDFHTVSLKDHSSLRIGGEGKLVEAHSVEELKEALSYAASKGLRAYILGEGTNSYFSEDLSDLLFIRMNKRGIEAKEEGEEILLSINAGEVWDDVVKLAVEKGWWGIENLSYIPGSVGAAPVQNIGAYGTELKDVLSSVRALDTETLSVVELTNEECEFGYRDSLFKRHPGRYVIISVLLKLSTSKHPVLTYKPLDSLVGKEVTPQEIRELVIRTRDAKLPDWKQFPNTGSFFKNPIVAAEKVNELRLRYPGLTIFESDSGYKVSAAWMIEHIAQAKGVRRGNIGTWPTQPLVLVNYGDATATELNAFADEIQGKIERVTGVRLDREVNFVV